MSIVLEAALSAFFDLLFYKLNSPDLLKIFRQENVDADIKKWKTILLEISEVLDDAEEKQITKVSVKTWLGELEALAYDADDILDEFATEALRRKLNAEEPSTSKIRKFIPACCVDFNPSSIKFDVSMRSKIEGIHRRLQEIVKQKERLKLQDCAGGRTITTISRPATTSLAESHTYGRDEDKKEIVKLLLESSDAQLSVIPIVGMGGLGKTTLAQLVYKDDAVSRYFDLKAWVCVSEDFDILRLTKEILYSFPSESCDDNNTLNSLQEKLQIKLSGKKFLLILDDVWCENYDYWTELRKPLESGALGSKIVVTTRNFGVASTMGTTPPYKLEELSCDACLHVFTHHALDATDFSKYPELEEFRQKIVNRCNGSPLAAKVLGGLLRTTRNRNKWKHVLNCKIFDIREEKSSIFSVLKLSYNYLPSHLKRCFAYCSLFPKDNEFDEKDLVLLWMAEGLVQETKGKKPMEDLGGDYFRDLLNRSFFQQSSWNKSLFVMHDLMNDLAMWAAGDLCCRLEDQLCGSKQSEISAKVRHLSYIEHSNDCIQKFDEDVHLRTFLSLPLYNQRGLTNFDVKYCLFPQLRCLRVLSLSGKDIFELPSSIGDLKHLRYLNLFYTKIESLPESTSSLYNLQTLILKGCSHLTKLPEKIENLVNLRHLKISNANSIREMPAGIAKLKSLRTLCFEHMDEWQDWIPCRVEREEFPCLRKLSISKCPKLRKFSYCLPSLEKVSIDACDQLTVTIPSRSVIQVLKIGACKKVVLGDLKVENLIIPSHTVIQVLTIEKCTWVVLGYLKGEKLKIEDCKVLTEENFISLETTGIFSFEKVLTPEVEIKSCPALVNIKLKSTLRTLTIDYCTALKSLEFVNNNASVLEHLQISGCPELELIVDKLDKDALLEDLVIRHCKKLRHLPRGLHELCHLKKICIYGCNSLISLENLLPTNLKSLEIEDWEKLVASPNDMHKLNFLQDLSIRDCPSIVSFPEEGFHTNLRKLCLSGENLCKQVFGLELHRLTLLTSLVIARGIMDSFPEEEDGKTMLMLPTSLTSLSLWRFPNLLFLSWKFFQNLSALEKISIAWCPKLESLSEKCFPPSLQQLYILDCPLLKKNCEKDKGIMWSKIANIPSVIINLEEQQK